MRQGTLTLLQPLTIRPLSLKLNFKIFVLLSSALTLSLLAFYIFQVSDLTKGTYSIKEYEKQAVVLSEENNDLKINFSKYNSLDNVEVLAQALLFEKITDAKYIQLMNNQVVLK